MESNSNNKRIPWWIKKGVPLRKMTKAEKIIKLIDNPGSNWDVDFFGARF